MDLSYEVFSANLGRLRAEMARVCAAAGRDPGAVRILPVTKHHPPTIVEYVARAGLPAVGENRVQEAREKRDAAATSAPSLRWELIGHLQSNKTRLAAQIFDRVQSVDSLRLLDLLDRAAAEQQRVLPILLQINAGRDAAKFGCTIEAAPELTEYALRCKNLRLDGLMTIAPLDQDLAVAGRAFATLRECRDQLAEKFAVPLAELSMGMSLDWREAIAAGSTLIRIGTALFGARA